MAARPLFHRVRVWALKLVLAFLIVTVLPVVILRFLAPPVTTLMIERRIASWFGKEKYSASYHWVAFEDIAPVMGAAVIASEDQNFPQHFGFDWKAIQKAMDHNEKSARTKARARSHSKRRKTCFYGRGVHG
jgi:monofunctional biosynthetic peptidoglycan transglycosylase